MGPARKICIVPYGKKTTKAVLEGLNRALKAVYFRYFIAFNI